MGEQHNLCPCRHFFFVPPCCSGFLFLCSIEVCQVSVGKVSVGKVSVGKVSVSQIPQQAQYFGSSFLLEDLNKD